MLFQGDTFPLCFLPRLLMLSFFRQLKIFDGGNFPVAPYLEYFGIILVVLGGRVLNDTKGEISHASMEFDT